MIPLRDANPSGTRPAVTLLLIFANLLAFLYELSLGPHLDAFITEFGLIPREVTQFLANPALGIPVDTLQSFVTSVFLHGSWVHLLGNMWYLWIFGDNIEDRLGHLRFLLFYLLCGVGASAIHVFFNTSSPVPTIGASGAIAGVLGAYIFCFPKARVLTLVPIFVFIQFVELPAFVLLFLWFVLQFFSGTLALVSANAGGVAWWAHVGGFVVGFVLILLFPRRRRARQSYYLRR